MKNWRFVLLIGLIASQTSCATKSTKYESRESNGNRQTDISIENQNRRQNDQLLTKSVERINWDNW